MNNKTEFKFGDYAIIEQKRHGSPNEMFVHKVIDQLRSNTWVDVPVQSPATETIHDEMEDVCLCICCGVDETEVRRYRVKDMRCHSPVYAVTDEKRGSTITLQAVNELIATLESAGEPSIREQKFLKLAKAHVQLAAENVSMDGFVEEMLAIAWQGGSADGSDIQELALKHGLIRQEVYCADEHENCVYDPGNFDDGDAVYFRTETPATDHIVAEAEARGVEKAIAHLEKKFSNIGVQIMNLQWLADSLRKGASE
ncbi:TPA: hypothetical protein ACU8I9_000948 [Klebsiella pneumoniae]